MLALLAAGLMAKASLEPRLISLSTPSLAAGQPMQVVSLNSVDPSFDWDEMILSWNIKGAGSSSFKFEARVIQEDAASKWYTLGLWNLAGSARTSVKGQSDEFGDVATDTLRVAKPGGRVELRCIVTRIDASDSPSIDLLTASFSSKSYVSEPVTPSHLAWGTELPIITRSQMSYKGGDGWCSPTSVSMALSFWSEKLREPNLDVDVPEVGARVNDPGWPGTGNWPFNCAYVGSKPSMVAYVTRLRTIEDLEAWIAAGVPVATSVNRLALEGKEGKPLGHLIVLRGFTKDGDPIFNDPGWSKEIRQVYKRANFQKAWDSSRRTVYLMYPSGYATPKLSGPWLER